MRMRTAVSVLCLTALLGGWSAGQQPNTSSATLLLNGQAGPTYPAEEIAEVGSSATLGLRGIAGGDLLLAVSRGLHTGRLLIPEGSVDLDLVDVTFPLALGFASLDQNGELDIVVPEVPAGWAGAYQFAVLHPALPSGGQLSAALRPIALTPGAAQAVADHTLEIRATDGPTPVDRPLLFGQGFREGEVAGHPGLVLGGMPLASQAEVKSRWADGSVKFAVMSCHLPALAQGEALQIGFRDVGQSPPVTTVSAAPFLDPAYDFDATIVLESSGQTLVCSAREMLASGAFEVWQSGPISTTLILREHLARSFDVGFDAHHSLRPLFHVTFFPRTHDVFVRAILENADTRVLQDQSYDLRLELGDAQPSIVYEQDGILHKARTRWTRRAWIGGAPAPLDVEHDLDHLIAGNFLVPMRTNPLSPAARDALWQEHLGRSLALYEAGDLRPSMGSPGWHKQIGPYPQWDVEALRGDGDHRLLERMLKNADLAAAWPLHYREGDVRGFDELGMIAGQGRVLSTRMRPTIMLMSLTYSYTHVEDRVVPLQTLSYGPWTLSREHLPNLHYVPYLVTGDPFYLEEMQFTASWAQGYPNGAATNYFYGRGPTGREGLIFSRSPRCMAWTGQQRLHTAFISPDGTPEKAYFEILLMEAIAGWEGERDGFIAPSPLRLIPELDACYVWGDAHTASYDGAATKEPSGFYQLTAGNPAYSREHNYVDVQIVESADAGWQQHFFTHFLATALRMGYPTERLCAFVAQNYLIHMHHPDFMENRLTAYVEPVRDTASGAYFQSVSELYASWLPTLPTTSTGLNSNWEYVKFANVAVSGVEYALRQGVLTQDTPIAPILQQVTPSPHHLRVWSEWQALIQDDTRYYPSAPFHPAWDLVPEL